MKRNITLLLMTFCLSCMFGCESNENEAMESTSGQTQLMPSLKGYELYSWKTDGQWNYTLITGTNRNKAYDEIVSPDNIENKEWVKISVKGLDNLKKLLARVPANEYISWVNSPTRVAGFSLPEATVVLQITNHCSDLDLNLQIIQ